MWRRAVPWVVTLATCALLATSVYAAERVGAPPPVRGAVARFVPADGAAAYVEVDHGAGAPVTQVVESARGNGVTTTQALTFVFGALLLQGLGDDAATAQVWRTTATTVRATADRTAQPDTLLYRVDAAVELLGENIPGRGRAYRPGLVELPADVTPGATWGGRGQVLTGVFAETVLGYASSFRAEAAADGCLRAVGEVAYTDAAGRPAGTERHRKLWCPGRGLVEQQVRTAAMTLTTRPVPAPERPSRPTVSPPLRWSDPAGWSVTSARTGTVDPNLGDYDRLTGAPTLVPPVLTASGNHYRALNQGDILGVAPQTPERWRSTARMHPGGAVLTLAAFGDVLVATTSRRQAVGYTADGIRLWTLDLPDIASAAAVRVSDTDVVLADIGGGLRRLDVRTGAVGWQVAVGFDVEVPPTVAGDRVVVSDRGGRQTAYAVGTGEVAWRTERTASSTAYAGGLLYTVDRESLEAVDVADGSVRWRRVVDGALNQLVTVDGRAAVATTFATYLVDSAGTEVARLPPYDDVNVAPGYLVGWTRSTVQAWTSDGRLRAGWTPPAEPFTIAVTRAVAEPAGLRLPYVDWRLDLWAAAP